MIKVKFKSHLQKEKIYLAPPSYEEIFGKAEIPEGTNQQGLPGIS